MEKQQFLDHTHAKIYNLYRPDIPLELIQKIIAFLSEKYDGTLDMAVDVGCGSGQSTAILSKYFQRVTGIDVSEAQLNEAKSREIPNVEFLKGQAESLAFEDNSVQLVTACASIHWFDQKRFFAEVKRVLVPGGVFAPYTYHFVKPYTDDDWTSAEIENLFEKKYEELYPYFPEAVFSSLNKYEEISFPFEEVIRAPNVRQTFSGSFGDVIGYIETLSGYQCMMKQKPRKAKMYISNFTEELKKILKMDTEDKNLQLYRDFYVIFCRKA